MQYSSDIAVVGSGLAGLTLALNAANAGYKVAIITKDALKENSSYYAQGGIAAVWGLDDSFESHVEDTLTAGAGLCNKATVEFVVNRGPESIQWLVDNGVFFSRRAESGKHASEFHLSKEGGHSRRRVIHAADSTGRDVENTLVSQIESQPNILVLENYIAIELITRVSPVSRSGKACRGLYVLDIKSNEVHTVASRYCVLATGGASKTYLYTSNPDTSTGDGIAMAWRAGCRIANLEFVQFHPTCLYHPHAKSFLITEAIRGEGGKLILPSGERFMHRYDEREELAPRDIVARALDREMKSAGLDNVYLDISFKSRSFLEAHFPNVLAKCASFGIDIATEPIPVVPAAHYTCGGIVTNHQAKTDIDRLYAIGESASTGLHGANRLASNSLLECLVFAHAAFKDIDRSASGSNPPEDSLPPWDASLVSDPDELIVIAHNWDELRRVMWDYVGIVRTTKRLVRALHRVELLADEVRDFYSSFSVNRDLIELRNLVLVAELIVRCALERKESRGLHSILDYPKADDRFMRDTVLEPPPR